MTGRSPKRARWPSIVSSLRPSLERRRLEVPRVSCDPRAAAQGQRQVRLRRDAQPSREIPRAAGLKIEGEVGVALRSGASERALDAQFRKGGREVELDRHRELAQQVRQRAAAQREVRALAQERAARAAPQAFATAHRNVQGVERERDRRVRRRRCRSSIALQSPRARARGRAPATPASHRGRRGAGRHAPACPGCRMRPSEPAPGRRAPSPSRRTGPRVSALAPPCRVRGARRTGRRQPSRRSAHAYRGRRRAARVSHRASRRAARATGPRSNRRRRRPAEDRAGADRAAGAGRNRAMDPAAPGRQRGTDADRAWHVQGAAHPRPAPPKANARCPESSDLPSAPQVGNSTRQPRDAVPCSARHRRQQPRASRPRSCVSRRVEFAARAHARAGSFEVEREGPRRGSLLKEPERPALDRDGVRELLVRAAAQRQPQRIVPRCNRGHFVQIERRGALRNARRGSGLRARAA